MTELERFLAEADPEQVSSVNGMSGTETGWLGFGSIECRSGTFLVIDPAFAPNAEDGVVVECAVGTYHLHAKVLSYGSDKRVSRLRALKDGVPVADDLKQVGEAWADVARVGICDAEEFRSIFPDDEDDAEQLIDEYLESDADAGSLIVSGRENTPLKYVSSGFGDGTFPVYAHMSGGETVGLEVEFIPKGTPYPFGGKAGAPADSGNADAASHKAKDDPTSAMLSVLSDFKSTGNREADKEQLRTLLETASAPFVEKVRGAAKEFCHVLIAGRRNAPSMELGLRQADFELSEAEQARVNELKELGFVGSGQFTCNLSKVRLTLAVLPGKKIYADVLQEGAKTLISLNFKQLDGGSVSVRPYRSRPGLPGPPWLESVEIPDATVAELLARAQMLRDRSPAMEIASENLPEIFEAGFRRLQLWRADRGGWSREEIQLQLGQSNIQQDDLEERRARNADMWLFNWLRAQPVNSVDPAKEVENLVVVHDDLSSQLLQAIWVWSTGDVKVRGEAFKQGQPREAFRQVAEQNAGMLRLLTRKTTGFAADFYLKPSPE